MTRTELLDLFTNVYDQFVVVGAQSFDAKHSRVFDVIVDPTKDWKYNAMSGLGMWDEVAEDSDTGLDHFIIGYEGTITPVKYRKYFYVTFEANDQMEYAALKSQSFKAEALGRGGMATIDKLCADILIDGFSTACADGQYLFSNSHPKNPEETGTTYDNLLSGAFSHDNLEAAEKQVSAEFFDMDGLPMAAYAGKPIIVHGSALRGPVKRVLSDRANEQPDTTTRNINVYAGKYDSLEWPMLDAAMGGSDTAWFIIYPALKNLKLVKNTANPQYASWIENLNQRYYFDGYIHAQAEAVDWRGLFASTGT
jgi:hypothetical protein